MDHELIGIIDKTPCHTHRAYLGEPCWTLDSTVGYSFAICGARARTANFNK